MEFIWSYLALACFSIADPSKIEKRQQVEIESALANLLLHQCGQLLDIICVSTACTSIDLQTGETVVMRETNLQYAEVALQVLLLVNHQLEPATANRFNGVTRHIEASCIDFTRLLAGAVQKGLHGSCQVAGVGHHQFNIRICRPNAGQDWHTGCRTCVSGVVDLQVDHFQSSCFKSILYALGALTAACLRQETPQA